MKTNTTSKTTRPARKATAQPRVPALTIGIDMGDRKHAVCAIDRAGETVDERTITNTRESLRRLSKKHPGARVVIEVGSHSPWTSRFLSGLGHEVIVANPRKVRAIYQNERKSDELDARMLAKIGRLDPSLLHPVVHGGEEEQRDLLSVKLRCSLVRQRVDAISAVRFTLKSLGHRLPSPNTGCFAKRARAELEQIGQPDLVAAVEPSLQVIDLLTAKIKEYDKAIAALCEDKYPETSRLRQVTGVGPVTAVTYRLVVGDPERFSDSRDVGAYFGFVPRRDQSGGLDKELRISKAGNAYMRTLLVGAAQYILGPFGPDCDLRRRGLELAARGGRGAKKKAAVATARKLSVLLHALWTKGGDYRPLRAEPENQAAA